MKIRNAKKTEMSTNDVRPDETLRGTQNNPTYASWRQAQRRCTDPRTPSYPNYGGRGIKFLIPSWRDIASTIGPRPPGHTLDRIDSDGHYEIGNIKWSTQRDQNRNRRSVKCNEVKAEAVRDLYKRGCYPDDIARGLNLNVHTVIAIIKGKQWRQ